MTADQWSAVGSVATALVGLVALVFVPIQLSQARELREEQAQPYVVVDLMLSDVSNRHINLVVENIGRTLARNVRLTFDPPLNSSKLKDELDLSRTALMRHGIPTLPPGKRVQALFDEVDGRAKAQLPMEYKVKVDFRDSRNRSDHALEYILDLTHIYGLANIREYGVHDAAKALTKVATEVERWTAHFNGIRVYVQSEAVDGDLSEGETS